ncbi:Xylulokinase [Komagataella phaffii CBS 7435]|uniref:Xylulose kinase n=2 Tax=Komagataella phaffii TaxID=460519 RepID=C4QWN1_KOMPG|nr:Xylulokinase, converts D-xylulose and ATP to xylulose 5-phosphate and ADP [Komagataella phaffii GS115]AOA61737.1 GQ67_02863T0 [Komagataella phaffii]CAH2446390.1 Xylulokinase [Komagataella phaffii CBS 7435]AOA65728.1 GQ68_02384T0 [Komagataella phaffii GS115]CAY67654.1 Xylulokinase, converts D-xylulose and ATP to xylulose 5-phosphate and ADP [Komagataella phaffii GS115]CCA36747.1 Xylulokinase [Komagataella phaffii CBS 7435]
MVTKEIQNRDSALTESVPNDLYLGFDLSTQQLKITSFEGRSLTHFKTYRVDFDEELSVYGINNGVYVNEETGEINAPVAMWVEALDLIFSKMQKDKFPFGIVKGMSGSCQQHGSVYWSKDAPDLLSSLSPSKDLKSQLCPKAFTFEKSPNWQDHSTGEELEIFERKAGSPENLSKITGSRAHYRFTGSQIRKLAKRVNPELYKETYRISLISSFLSSLLCGRITKIEESDGCGMNIYDIQNSRYDEDLLAVTAAVDPEIDGATEHERQEGVARLKDKLQDLEPVGYRSIGTIAAYFVEKYGFSEDSKVFSFTGDNLATILSLPLHNDDILVSLGTSTTVLLVTETYWPNSNYHVFKHPTVPGSYMVMLCYVNGALARNQIKTSLDKKYNVSDPNDWTKFNEILDKSKPLHGKEELGVYFPKGEIIPNCVAQTKRFSYDAKSKKLVTANWDIEDDVVSIVESQALSCRLRSGPLYHGSDETDQEEESEVIQRLSNFPKISADGKDQRLPDLISHPKKAFYVGGASQNVSIVRKFSEVLGAKEGNYQINLGDACAIGGAFKAVWSDLCETEKAIPYSDFLRKNFHWKENVKPVEADSSLWLQYVDGVGILSEIEQTLEK